MEKPFDFAFFPEIRYDHLLRGRTGAFIDNLQKRGFYIYYFERPPDSPLQYFKDPISSTRGLSNFLFPKPIMYENIEIFPQQPVFPAKRFNRGIIKQLNINILTRKIQAKYKNLVNKRNKPVVAFVVTPWWYDVIKGIQFSYLCYDCIDDIKVFCEERELKYFNTLQKQLVKKSDLILFSAKRLKNEIQEIRTDAQMEYLPNAVDGQLFIDKNTEETIPDDLKTISKPIIGFIGSIFNWVDISLIKKTAENYPTSTVVLIGPLQGVELPRLSNIIHLGPKPYSLIPSYINAFDVCLIPFINDPLSDKVDPIKVYEYLSLGKPVVAINLAELEKMQSLIYLAKNNEEFIAFIKKALNENNQELKLKRIQYAKENSWDVRITDLINILSKNMKGKTKNIR